MIPGKPILYPTYHFHLSSRTMGSSETVATTARRKSPEKLAAKSGGKGKSLAVCVVDNGGWKVKYGIIVPPKSVESKVSIHMSTMYNATARPPHQLTVLTGDEITARMKNLGQLSWNYPMERGMICDGETQLRVWARTLEVLGVSPSPQMKGGGGGFLATLTSSTANRRGKGGTAATDTSVSNTSMQKYSSNDCMFLLLEPPHVPSVISEGVDCILFRELGIGNVARVLGPCMAAAKYLSIVGKTSSNNSDDGAWIDDDTKCCCVVDSGYSFTHVVPTHRGSAMKKAIRRLDIGGKVLTNLLKETVTYRQWNMMDEFHIVNDAKEQLSFVSDKFDSEMKQAHITRKGLRWFDREYLLPDFVSSSRGSVRLPVPLQRKNEMEEMAKKKLELERQKEEEKGQNVSEEEAENYQQNDEDDEMDTDKREPANDTKDKQKKKTSDKKHKKEKSKKKMKKQSKKRKYDDQHSDNDEELSDNEDSDEETDEQRLKRLKAMREEERKRREKEERERQALAMSVERFTIPEVLFRPSDIGLNCGGVVEAIVESINACDPIYRAAMYNNVLLVGGNATIPGYRERVESELRKLAPTNYPVRVYLPNDPVTFAWEGAVEFAQQSGFQKQYSIDRVTWEAMKKTGKDQEEIWGDRMYNMNR